MYIGISHARVRIKVGAKRLGGETSMVRNVLEPFGVHAFRKFIGELSTNSHEILFQVMS